MCDTFVVLSSVTADGSVILGKNSDREPNEIQSFEYHPPKEYPEGSTVRCTYETIPQVKETLGVWLSRPFWMWGAEMGANEAGVAIGNEAVFTKIPLNRKSGLTGMDLLRLALERGRTAESAMEIIIQLLTDIGQGGLCGYEDKKLAYHNSFIIADYSRAWILETAGPHWVAKEVKNYGTISNGLTIGGDFDHSSPDVEDVAREKGWLKPGRDFSFAECYSDWFYTTFSASRQRRACSAKSVESETGSFSVSSAFRTLRDHGGPDYRPDKHFLMNQVCAHSANILSRHASQSTNSMVAHLRPEHPVIWSTTSSAPCTGVYKPHSLHALNRDPETTGPETGERLWKAHEHLHRSVLQDFRHRLSVYQAERDSLEERFIAATVRETLTADQESAFRKEAQAREAEWLAAVQDLPVREKPLRYYRKYWERQNRRMFPD
ncbi:MAG: acyl-CoA--6-aminopenicillanic acid acyltransferase [FCB group bacterium]|nr:acyl-CoA--6-aminopenicillanic acid acyltransferase [FCB group bacterium]